MAVEPGTRNVITGISSMAMRHVLAELGDAYEQQSGQPVSVVSVGGVDAARRVDDGEAFDFVVLAADVIGSWQPAAVSIWGVEPISLVPPWRSR